LWSIALLFTPPFAGQRVKPASLGEAFLEVSNCGVAYRVCRLGLVA